MSFFAPAADPVRRLRIARVVIAIAIISRTLPSIFALITGDPPTYPGQHIDRIAFGLVTLPLLGISARGAGGTDRHQPLRGAELALWLLLGLGVAVTLASDILMGSSPK